jgi:cyclopropane-fatty-acyl-phospholipid synthase
MEMEICTNQGKGTCQAQEKEAKLSFLERAGLRGLARAVSHWHGESILLTLPDGKEWKLGDLGTAPRHQIAVRNPRIFRRILLRADLGLGEGFVAGDWESPDLAGLLQAFVRQGAKEDTLWSRSLRVVDWFQHRLNANTLAGSEKNIRAHYDLGNDFYKAWLGPTMQYSAGIYPTPDASLEASQDLKLATLIEKLQVKPGMHVLEIGSGWGELAVRLVRDHGCLVTTVTLSLEQHAWVQARVRELGLEGRLDARVQDYRAVEGRFDRVVSVEMIEAVGHENLSTYFRCIEERLKPGGHAVIQAITVPEQNYARYLRRTDWIQAHVFPGAVCPSIQAMVEAMGEGSRLVLRHLEDIGPHYARNLAHWRERFLAAWPSLQTLGFDDRFRRLWTYYLAYCEAGFAQRKLGDVQMILGRACETGLPDTLPSSSTQLIGART